MASIPSRSLIIPPPPSHPFKMSDRGLTPVTHTMAQVHYEASVAMMISLGRALCSIPSDPWFSKRLAPAFIEFGVNCAELTSLMPRLLAVVYGHIGTPKSIELLLGRFWVLTLSLGGLNQALEVDMIHSAKAHRNGDMSCSLDAKNVVQPKGWFTEFWNTDQEDWDQQNFCYLHEERALREVCVYATANQVSSLSCLESLKHWHSMHEIEDSTCLYTFESRLGPVTRLFTHLVDIYFDLAQDFGDGPDLLQLPPLPGRRDRRNLREPFRRDTPGQPADPIIDVLSDYIKRYTSFYGLVLENEKPSRRRQFVGSSGNSARPRHGMKGPDGHLAEPSMNISADTPMDFPDPTKSVNAPRVLYEYIGPPMEPDFDPVSVDVSMDCPPPDQQTRGRQGNWGLLSYARRPLPLSTKFHDRWDEDPRPERGAERMTRDSSPDVTTPRQSRYTSPPLPHEVDPFNPDGPPLDPSFFNTTLPSPYTRLNPTDFRPSYFDPKSFANIITVGTRTYRPLLKSHGDYCYMQYIEVNPDDVTVDHAISSGDEMAVKNALDTIARKRAITAPNPPAKKLPRSLQDEVRSARAKKRAFEAQMAQEELQSRRARRSCGQTIRVSDAILKVVVDFVPPELPKLSADEARVTRMLVPRRLRPIWGRSGMVKWAILGPGVDLRDQEDRLRWTRYAKHGSEFSYLTVWRFMQDPAFKGWMDLQDSSSSRYLWLYGGIGSGKSALAAAIISQFSSELKSFPRNSETPIIAYHFFDLNRPMSPIDIYRSLLYQIVNTRHIYTNEMKKLEARISELRELIFLSPEEVKTTLQGICKECSVYFILDGMDECNEAWMKEIIRGVTGFGSRQKVLCLSRPHSVFIDVFDDLFDTAEFRPHQDDMMDYLLDTINNMPNVWEPNGVDLALHQTVVDTVMGRADGSWEYVNGMATALIECSSADEIEDTLELLPLEMVERLNSTLLRLEKSPYPWSRMALLLFFWVNYYDVVKVEHALALLLPSPKTYGSIILTGEARRYISDTTGLLVERDNELRLGHRVWQEYLQEAGYERIGYLLKDAPVVMEMYRQLTTYPRIHVISGDWLQNPRGIDIVDEVPDVVVTMADF